MATKEKINSAVSSTIAMSLLFSACARTEATVNPDPNETKPSETLAVPNPLEITATPSPTTEAKFELEITPITPDSPFVPAINPPEYKAAGGEIVGVSPEELQDERNSQWYRLFKRVNGLEGSPYYFSGSNQEEAQKNFDIEMEQFALGHPEVAIRQLQSEDKTSVLTYLVEEKDGVSSVYWGFTPEGALAFAEPNLSDEQTKLDTIRIPKGLQPEFVYNLEDKHWYMFGVDEQGEARMWFNTDGATKDNLEKQWTEIEEKLGPIETEFEGVFSEKYYPDQFTDSFTVVDKESGIEIPMHIGLAGDLPVKAVHLTELGREYLGHYFLLACYYRYSQIMGNQVSYEEYLGLIKEGNGHLEINFFDEITGEAKTNQYNPKNGISITITDNNQMPLDQFPSDYTYERHEYITVNNTGKIIIAQELDTLMVNDLKEGQIQNLGRNPGFVFSNRLYNDITTAMRYWAMLTPEHFFAGGVEDINSPQGKLFDTYISEVLLPILSQINPKVDNQTPFMSVELSDR